MILPISRGPLGSGRGKITYHLNPGIDKNNQSDRSQKIKDVLT